MTTRHLANPERGHHIRSRVAFFPARDAEIRDTGRHVSVLAPSGLAFGNSVTPPCHTDLIRLPLRFHQLNGGF